jgi:predicted flavoprotein YhiN
LNKLKKHDIAIIGGGASGLVAAVLALKRGKSVAVYERENRVGKKLLRTGNGRCNLSNLNMDESHYFGSIKNIGEIISSFSAKEFFGELGLLLRSDNEGRVYPYSNSANSVVDALRGFCLQEKYRGKYTEFCDTEVTDLSAINADEFKICTGGGSAASFFGEKPVQTSPALCPIFVREDIRSLKGIRFKCLVSRVQGADCRGQIAGNNVNGNHVNGGGEYGEVQFTDNALSGICIFNQSIHYTTGMKITLDLCPEYSEEEIAGYPLTGIYPKMLAMYMQKNASRKYLHFTATGLDKSKAQVTRGGVSAVNEFLQSKKNSHTDYLGEALDVVGECGGYNLHFAFASAYFNSLRH